MNPVTLALPGEPRNIRDLPHWLAARERAHQGNPQSLTPREYVMVTRLARGADRPAYSIV